ncbi:MAG TPA: MMPL family transporter [Actinomycetes bacterium]|nr:MMPL family transporter [Actinomycetes bacterium]
MVFERMGRLVYRRRRLVLSLTGLFVAIALTWGTGVFGALSDGGFEDPGAESSTAAEVIDSTFGHVTGDVVVVYRADQNIVGTGAGSGIERALEDLPPSAVTSVTSYWSTGGDPGFVSADGRTTFATLALSGDTDAQREEAYLEVAGELQVSGVESFRGGQVPTFVDINSQIESDLARAEMLSFPILLLLLVVVFGSVAAASLPLAVGGISILGAFTLLNVATKLTDVSVLAINIVTLLGLGLAIDYALFVVSRFREELAAGYSVEDAVSRTMATAGRTVAISGLTVAVALGALLLFPMNFLQSMGLGGIAAVLVAMVAALTTLPALLGVLGHRVDALRVPWRRNREVGAASDEGAWARLARWVMRRPIMVMVATVTLLAVLGAPFFQVTFGGVDARVLPADAESRVAGELLGQEFPESSDAPVDVLVEGADGVALDRVTQVLREVSGVSSASVTASDGDTSVVALAYAGESSEETAQQVVTEVRALGPQLPADVSVKVTGETARLVDLMAGIGNRLPWALGYIAVVTFLLLFLAFGSIVLPIKAIVMNVLSLSATFGVLVWGFQQGNLEGLLGFTATGTLEATQPVLMFAMVFGLSMDYEVFLLSRIREEWDRTGDNTQAVARGLQRTGRIITSAALLFVVVAGSFATSGISFIQMIGVGLAVAVVIDATLVRAFLVPATMRLLGRWNWWAPAPMLRFWERFGIGEVSELPESERKREPALA